MRCVTVPLPTLRKYHQQFIVARSPEGIFSGAVFQLRKVVLTEKDLLDMELQGYDSRFAHALLAGIGVAQANNRDVLLSLVWMYKTLSKAAQGQRSSPEYLDSIASYIPPLHA